MIVAAFVAATAAVVASAASATAVTAAAAATETGGRQTEANRGAAASSIGLAAKQPSGRLVTPDEVADAVWSCVVDDSINGQGIDVLGDSRS